MLPARLQESQPTVHLRHLLAVNTIRKRARVEGVNAKYTGSIDLFNSEIRRERAVELAYEGHRFTDLRRWLLIDKKPYTEKTAVDFQRVGDLAENPQETKCKRLYISGNRDA